jgi:DNA topoisomerase-1
MASKKLVVVESPAKAKTINKYLGSTYVVEASVGHIKDLITYRLGVEIEKDFEPKYVTIRGKGDIIKRLNKLAKDAKEVLIATDPDREGEAIAWHIAEEVKKKNNNVKRVLFNEITKDGVKRGLANPMEINESVFMSQQARRVMDRLIGYKVSPFLSRAMLSHTSKALSAGRVQSVALRMLCEREEEILSFVPIDYWSILGKFDTEIGAELNARLVAFDGDNIKNPEGSAKSTDEAEQKKIDKELAKLHYIKSDKQADELMDRIKKESFIIDEIQKKNVQRRPYAPFTTSSLQQEASRRLGFSNKKTMSVAQKLYEGVNLGESGTSGLITYMRTDSVRLSPESQKAAAEYIKKNYGKDYLPDTPPQYASKSKSVQDAHEAIRPTSVEFEPKKIKKYLDNEAFKLYQLIYNRFVASQMKPAIMEQTTINIKGGDFIFRATGSVIKFKGFLALYEDIKEDDKNGNDSGILPEGLTEKQKAELKKLDKNQSQTKPKPRYNEATLVKELDERGIGRPSTYASIISTLTDREYAELSKKTFTPTHLGMHVNKVLVENFPDLFNVEFTAEMEEELDIIADGNKTYVDAMKGFYKPFSQSLEKAEKSGNIPEIPCPECGAPMVIKVSRRGRFLGCSRYPECKGTQPLPKDEEKAKQEPVKAEGMKCPECGKDMYLRESRYGRFYGCEDYPNCKGILQVSTGVTCPKCNEGEMVERFSPKTKKKFWGCSNYPKCNHLMNHEPVAKKCDKCGNDYLEIRFKKASDGWEKYIVCPKCKTNYPIEE